MFKEIMAVHAHKTYRERDDIALPVALAAVWGGFLHEGLMNSNLGCREPVILGHWRLGCLELLQTACAVLPALWTLAKDEWAQNPDLGVFEYEVVALLGVYLGDFLVANNGQLPTLETAMPVMQSLITDYYQPVIPATTAP